MAIDCFDPLQTPSYNETVDESEVGRTSCPARCAAGRGRPRRLRAHAQYGLSIDDAALCWRGLLGQFVLDADCRTSDSQPSVPDSYYCRRHPPWRALSIGCQAEMPVIANPERFAQSNLGLDFSLS